jgi:hypothetical protein
LTLEFSSNVIGNSSMVTWRKQFLPMLLHWGERMLTYIYSSTLTMLVISWHDDCVWDSWYISTWHRLFRIQRSNPQSKLVCLVLSLLLWNKAWRHCKAYNTNYEWWVFKSMDNPILMVIICMWYITPNDLPGWINTEEEVQLSVPPWGTWVSCYGWIPNWPHFYSWKPCGYLYKDYTQWNDMRSLGWSNSYYMILMIPTPADAPPWWLRKVLVSLVNVWLNIRIHGGRYICKLYWQPNIIHQS